MTPLTFLLISFAGFGICAVDHLAANHDANYPSGLTLIGAIIFSIGMWGFVVSIILEFVK